MRVGRTLLSACFRRGRCAISPAASVAPLANTRSLDFAGRFASESFGSARDDKCRVGISEKLQLRFNLRRGCGPGGLHDRGDASRTSAAERVISSDIRLP